MSVKQIDKLFELPKKEKGLNKAHFQPLPPNDTQQMDLLALPEDKKKFCGCYC
jgi:hypothetical protein